MLLNSEFFFVRVVLCFPFRILLLYRYIRSTLINKRKINQSIKCQCEQPPNYGRLATTDPDHSRPTPTESDSDLNVNRQVSKLLITVYCGYVTHADCYTNE